MPTTYEPIATSSPGTVGQVTFSSISSAYTDLVVIVSINPGAQDQLAIRFNNDSSVNYSLTRITGNGSTASSTRVSDSTYPIVMDSTYSAGFPCSFKIDIFNYAGNKFKTFLSSASVNKNGSGEQTNCVGLWRSTSAINRIDLYGSFTNGTRVTLYGILRA